MSYVLATVMFCSYFLLSRGFCTSFPRRTSFIQKFSRRFSNSLSTDELITLQKLADESRGLSIDAISKAKSGHLGLPLGCAEVGALLWGKFLSYLPENPEWINRDRFVLSAGHGSMFLYSWLHLAGYDLSINDLSNFRKLHSKTPGHPESKTLDHYTPGVEATTGPLGTGIGNAVGMAVASKMSASLFNTAKHKIIDHHVVVLCGDGCLQEGVSFEAMAYAGREGLDNLILIYDSNNITLDKPAEYTQALNTTSYFRSLGWNVLEVDDGHNLAHLNDALFEAKNLGNHHPTAIIVNSIIGKGIEEVERRCAAHGEAGVKFGALARQRLGLPKEPWFVSDQSRCYLQEQHSKLKEKFENWEKIFEDWKNERPELYELLLKFQSRRMTDSADSLLQALASNVSSKSPVSMRQACGDLLQPFSRLYPNFLSGAADLFSSTKNYLTDAGDFGNPEVQKNYGGRNIHYGIREHAMGAIMNGICLYGLHRPAGATFLAFSDYLRPTLRLAALSQLQVLYLFTHDSILVGEDGPTHQPIEQLSSLRLIPNMQVIRPADVDEMVGALTAYACKSTGPTSLILSRQDLPYITTMDSSMKQHGVLRGGYIIRPEVGLLKGILIASGSEVSLALAAAEELGSQYRVVSMPCMELFDSQDNEYKESILPQCCRARVAVEAGVSALWYKYVGSEGKIVGVDHFGMSAPSEDVRVALNLTKEKIIDSMNALKTAT